MFEQQSHMKPHDRQTDTGIIDHNSPHLMHAMRSNNNEAESSGTDMLGLCERVAWFGGDRA